ncbi:hypothetical protein WMY93_017094 [Mugilogobius chulae]|uniref:Uncharacterized protein n=1 Tax=Mugilogobius chulae TaxID=88201 RepID=A0AAW0NYA0_9GOBI
MATSSSGAQDDLSCLQAEYTSLESLIRDLQDRQAQIASRLREAGINVNNKSWPPLDTAPTVTWASVVGNRKRESLPAFFDPLDDESSLLIPTYNTFEPLQWLGEEAHSELPQNSTIIEPVRAKPSRRKRDSSDAEKNTPTCKRPRYSALACTDSTLLERSSPAPTSTDKSVQSTNVCKSETTGTRAGDVLRSHNEPSSDNDNPSDQLQHGTCRTTSFNEGPQDC